MIFYILFNESITFHFVWTGDKWGAYFLNCIKIHFVPFVCLNFYSIFCAFKTKNINNNNTFVRVALFYFNNT